MTKGVWFFFFHSTSYWFCIYAHFYGPEDKNRSVNARIDSMGDQGTIEGEQVQSMKEKSNTGIHAFRRRGWKWFWVQKKEFEILQAGLMDKGNTTWMSLCHQPQHLNNPPEISTCCAQEQYSQKPTDILVTEEDAILNAKEKWPTSIAEHFHGGWESESTQL